MGKIIILKYNIIKKNNKYLKFLLHKREFCGKIFETGGEPTMKYSATKFSEKPFSFSANVKERGKAVGLFFNAADERS